MPPRKLYVELTSACNLDCATCYRRGWSEGARDMDPGIFRSLARQSRELDSIRTVVLGGIGEPSASPLFGEALEAFGDRDLVVTTNGVGLDAEAIAWLARRASLVVISVDGLDENLRRIRGVGLDALLGTVRRLVAERRDGGRCRVEFQFTLAASNATDLVPVVDLAADLGVDAVTVSHLLPQEAGAAADIMYGRHGRAEAARLFEAVRLRAFGRGVRVFLPPLELKTERRCAFAEDEAAYVNADGEVVPCYRFSHDGREYVWGRGKEVRKKPFGAILEASLGSIWDSAPYARLRRTLVEGRYPSCPDCDLLEGCDMVKDTASDCWANQPSCADCLWARGFMRCR